MHVTNAAAIALAALAGAAHASTVVTFDGGSQGWSINGWDTVSPAGGNPGANLHWEDFIDTFGIEVRNDSNPDFIGDYVARGPSRISIDVNVNYITFNGNQVARDWVLQLRDYDNAGDYPYVSVWFNAGQLPGPGDGWTTFTFDIPDVNSATLPAGWGGTGAENEFGEPMLPAHRTYSDILASVDEIVFTTYVPGYFYGFTHFDIAVDNINLRPIPAPGAAAVLAMAGVCGLRRRR